MNIGHVYIKGLIGSFEDEIGVTLKDVIMQVEAKNDADLIHVHINSQGGCVDTGNAIATYLSKQSKVHTIAEHLCASIATRIHLSVPVARRKIVAGTEYFIHNPLFEGVSGNAKELREAADYLDPVQKELVSMYCKETTASKEAIEGMMDAETSMNSEECKTLGFVSIILPRLELKAVAFKSEKEVIKKENISNKTFKMTVLEQIKKGFAELKAELKGEETPEVKAMMVNTDNGELSYASEGDLPEVGEPVMIGEEVAPEGTYTVEGVAVIIVDAEGMVAEVTVIEEGDVEEDSVEALKATIEQMKVDAEAAMNAKDEEFKATLETAVNELKEEIVAAKALVGSSFEPKAEKKVFNKAKAELSPREKMEERKAELKARKQK